MQTATIMIHSSTAGATWISWLGCTIVVVLKNTDKLLGNWKSKEIININFVFDQTKVETKIVIILNTYEQQKMKQFKQMLWLNCKMHASNSF